MDEGLDDENAIIASAWRKKVTGLGLTLAPNELYGRQDEVEDWILWLRVLPASLSWYGGLA
jgi:hypothetical protein